MDYELMMNSNIKIGQRAPEFTAETTYGKRSLKDYKGKWLVFFSYPGDFNYICTTEIMAFSKAYSYFQKMNAELLGLSIDSNATHLAWMNEIFRTTGISVPFPIVADRSGEIARLYGMISKDVSSTQTVRDVVIVDPNGVVKIILIYPPDVRRNIDEIIRVIRSVGSVGDGDF